MADRPSLFGDVLRMITKMVVGGILLIGLVSCGIAAIAGASMSATGAGGAPKTLAGQDSSANKIVRIDIVGPILTHKPDQDSGFFSSLQQATYGYETKRQLIEAAKDDSVKAVMLFVRTPGGTIVGSQAIHDGVMAVKESGKPIIAHIDMMSASGGVWSTVAADKIYADHGSLIGSVGVIFARHFYFDDPVAFDAGLFGGGVTTRGGIKTTVISSAEGKDLFNPFRPMTEREKALLTASTAEFYDQFIDHVTKHRPINRDRLINEYGAMVFANGLAEARGFIDGTSSYDQTIAHIASAIGASGDDWKLVAPPPKRRTPFHAMTAAVIGDRAGAAFQQAACAELRAGPTAMTESALVALCGF